MPAQRNIDLVLLEGFDTLMRERSVSRAAEKMGISQSSASEMLAKLRERFGDPLLVRSREGLVPTPRAEQLVHDARIAADGLRALLDGDHGFDPATSTQAFRIATSDYTQVLLMPSLMKAMQRDAPLCTVDIVPTHVLRVEQGLGLGEIDLAIAYFPTPPDGLRRSPLFQDRFVGLARAGHPDLQGVPVAVSAEAFAALRHVRVSPSGLSYFSTAIEAALEAQGLSRRIAVSVPQFLMATHLVAESDLVLVLPERVAHSLVGRYDLHTFELPFAVAPPELSMYWHERLHHGAAHRWFRRQVADVLAR